VADAPVLTGLLLAGGGSRRMGRDKTAPDFLFDGEPLAARVARLLGQVCDEVLVASGDGARMAWLGLPQIPDGVPDSGPLGGLVAGLERAAHPLVAAVAADMPFASPALLRLLASLADGRAAAVPVGDRGIEPLHAVYATAARPVLEAALQDRRLSVRDALAGLDVRTVGEGEWRPADPSGRFAWNVNRPEDQTKP
jgi:molybdopterin-guanine dinucleotide biosynthesis protein A